MLVCASLNFRPPATELTAALCVRRSADCGAGATGIVLGKHDVRGQDEVSRHHLAAAHVRALRSSPPLARARVPHHVGHADTAFNDEAVGLLDHV
jgi:hypothetical protein